MAMKPYRIKDIMNGDVHPLYDLQSFTFIANIYGGPSATVPCGFTEDGLPVGLQINGRIGDDATVLRASAAFEQARPWIQNIPPAAQGID
jgi:aspartyl-tRNA(Asn)/glutamyl-tRNA(Gln) amidotransferase subunit A